MTIKMLKEWGFEKGTAERSDIQRLLDGGIKIERTSFWVFVGGHSFRCGLPVRAVKFAAVLNKCRRSLHLIKQDLDQDWAERVKKRDNYICAGCNVMGDKIGETVIAHTEIDEDTGETRLVKERIKKDVLTAHHWLKTKSRAGMARWARACGVTYHYAEHIHTLHENPCWVDLEKIYRAVAIAEGEEAIKAALALVSVEPTEARVRALWLERCGNKKAGPE